MKKLITTVAVLAFDLDLAEPLREHPGDTFCRDDQNKQQRHRRANQTPGQ